MQSGHPESCSLSGEACSITSYKPGLWESVRTGHPVAWFSNGAETLGETFAMVPVRFRSWNARDYVPEGSDTYRPVDPAKPWALEIVDPGCSACAHLFRNIKAARFENRYNLAYLAFPIPAGGHVDRLQISELLPAGDVARSNAADAAGASGK